MLKWTLTYTACLRRGANWRLELIDGVSRRLRRHVHCGLLRRRLPAIHLTCFRVGRALVGGLDDDRFLTEACLIAFVSFLERAAFDEPDRCRLTSMISCFTWTTGSITESSSKKLNGDPLARTG